MNSEAHLKALDILRNPDKYTVYTVAWARDDLTHHDNEVLEAAAGLLLHKNPILREVGCNLLGEFNKRKFPVSKILLGLMLNDPDPNIKIAAANSYMPPEES